MIQRRNMLYKYFTLKTQFFPPKMRALFAEDNSEYYTSSMQWQLFALETRMLSWSKHYTPMYVKSLDV